MQKETSTQKGYVAVEEKGKAIEIVEPTQGLTSPSLFTEELMRRFRSAITMVGYTDHAPLEQNLFVCGSGFILEGQFLITASVVHDALSWREDTDIFAAIVTDAGSVQYIPITFIDSDMERGIAVYRLSTKLPPAISFSDIDFAENELITGVNALTLSYCTANESLCCHRTPILMSNQIYVRKGQVGDHLTNREKPQNTEELGFEGTFLPKTNAPGYAIIQGLVQEQEYGAPIVAPSSRWGPQRQKIAGIIGGSLESMYRDFVIIEENNQLRTARSFVGFTNSPLYTHMNEEIKSNASLINDASLNNYQSNTNEEAAVAKSMNDNDSDSFDEEFDAFMDESEEEEGLLDTDFD